MFCYQSVAFVYYGADRENPTAFHRPRLLSRIDLLHSYRTGPQQSWKDRPQPLSEPRLYPGLDSRFSSSRPP